MAGISKKLWQCFADFTKGERSAKGKRSTVVVLVENLKDQEFLQIAEMVSGVTGLEMEEVKVVEHSGT
ncbi:hypothetical protein [Candidatus Hakubella thermalkaliphila]|uniref:hypothetical protein n=1 Tax=Candidatus Hakubella thermalkaliphila TaxID=2754717 RepID=UPI001593BF0B|nr:hypothetical protein [Candidatus Hakubella thermalkaliphila]